MEILAKRFCVLLLPALCFAASAQAATVAPVDPGSGTGGVSITSVNGVPQVNPIPAVCKGSR